MDADTLAMMRIKPSSIFKKPILLTALIGTLASPMLHADALGDLIQQKNQTFTPPSYSGGSTSSVSPFVSAAPQNFHVSYAAAPNIKAEHIDTLYAAEQTATPASKQVLQTVRQMALDRKEIIKGSCWDYLNAAFTRAGVTRDTVFKGEYPSGPFVDTNEIKPGDWLYYVNHSYNDVEHSGLFVGWLDRSANQALILSYAGENRREPARYKVYDVSHTYNIMRPSF
ncbi:hypothetical protein [Psychrobacter sp. FDAARGOS_221]|uniref:hypothetical protein n=1 Tax=Psychrobacter sp. FDAARGOS_221 TaxID=1975705 RepID=UPI000BB59E22|nr:hypothetical protein [Psychrobacter sp. FDAARGOS_221]PNK60952.1 hypothetical protein A6J60_008715 [Psychrobacter sp. FDAARGOS_221]